MSFRNQGGWDEEKCNLSFHNQGGWDEGKCNLSFQYQGGHCLNFHVPVSLYLYYLVLFLTLLLWRHLLIRCLCLGNSASPSWCQPLRTVLQPLELSCCP